MLYNLHLLRVIAALGVVYFHATSVAGLRLDWDVGSRGVDVFFVISGFIIAYIGTSKPEQFFRRRLIRVVPFYWAATLFVFALVVAAPQMFRSTTSDLTHLVASLLFIPHEASNGEMHPTLILGWSLNFEMFFYVVFALALGISQRWSPVICVAWIVAFVIAIHTFASGSPAMNFYARPIVLEFCLGIGVFYVFQWCDARKAVLARIAGLRWGLLVIFLGSLAVIVALEQYYQEALPRHIAAGIPSFFLVASALLLERLFGMTTRSRVIYLLGEASYIIYLVHPYIVFSVLRLAVKDADALSSPILFALVVGLLALTSVISIAIHVLFEKPVMAFLRARLT
jgi:exopolysaccharide production protein ExoZ